MPLIKLLTLFFLYYLYLGQSSGTQLLGKLLEVPRKPTPLTVDTDSANGIIGGCVGAAAGGGLLALFQQEALINVPISERSSGKLSPTQAKR